MSVSVACEWGWELSVSHLECSARALAPQCWGHMETPEEPLDGVLRGPHGREQLVGGRKDRCTVGSEDLGEERRHMGRRHWVSRYAPALPAGVWHLLS